MVQMEKKPHKSKQPGYYDHRNRPNYQLEKVIQR